MTEFHEQYAKQIEQAIDYLQRYMNTYTDQPYYTEYSRDIVLDDILYGLGIALGGERFKYARGYDAWKRLLHERLRDDKSIDFLLEKYYPDNQI